MQRKGCEGGRATGQRPVFQTKAAQEVFGLRSAIWRGRLADLTRLELDDLERSPDQGDFPYLLPCWWEDIQLVLDRQVYEVCPANCLSQLWWRRLWTCSSEALGLEAGRGVEKIDGADVAVAASCLQHLIRGAGVGMPARSPAA